MWPDQIVVAVLVQQRIEELDSEGLWRRHLPAVAASEDDLGNAEQTLGLRLDPRYRAFLAHANGWRNFYTHVDLFGTQQLLGGEPMEAVRTMLSGLDPEVLAAEAGLTLRDTIPIGGSELSTDAFLLALPDSPRPGVVIWLADEPVEVYPDFDEFFLSMVDYNRYLISRLEGSSG
jgi:hypothetical protein